MSNNPYQKTILDNGLRLITATMPYTRSVAISFFIGAGSRYETEAEAGISHFIEHLCFRGTSKRPTAKDISTAIEGVGGILNGGTDKELTLYWCKVAQPYFQTALDVLVDMLLDSRFDPADMEKERQIIIEEINMSNDTPSQRVGLLIDELLWPGHPLGRDIAGSKQSVSSITREMLLGYLASHYRPDNTVLAIAGDIEHEEVTDAVNQALGKWAGQQPRPGYLAYEEKQAKRLRVETRETEQVQLCLALPGLSLLHPKRFALDLLNVILGEGMSSRLFTQIRDKLGLAYSINSYVDHFLDTGSLIISAGVEPKNLPVAIEAILEELGKLKELVPEAELEKAKEFAKGRLLLRMEDTRNVTGWMGGQEILTQHILSVDEVVAIFEAITTEELQELARELLVGERLRLAVVGPVPQDEPLEELLKL
ncbi:MAG TPA: insulinase family protein [Dehalococcoidia bacterium]|nr:insulinase family protein [Dehalococcoidia bacterium]